MHPLMLDILPLVRQGYCCSQLLVLMLLRSSGQEQPDLVRAMHGLCYGMGGSEGPCGLLTGGACVLGCVAGRGRDHEEANPLLAPLVHEYQQWFMEHTEGRSACCDILGHLGHSPAGEPDRVPGQPGTPPSPALCADLLAASWNKLCDLLEAYGLPLEPRA